MKSRSLHFYVDQYTHAMHSIPMHGIEALAERRSCLYYRTCAVIAYLLIVTPLKDVKVQPQWLVLFAFDIFAIFHENLDCAK